MFKEKNASLCWNAHSVCFYFVFGHEVVFFSHAGGLFTEILDENRYHQSLSPVNGPGLWQVDLYMTQWNPVSYGFLEKRFFLGFSMMNWVKKTGWFCSVIQKNRFQLVASTYVEKYMTGPRLVLVLVSLLVGQMKWDFLWILYVELEFLDLRMFCFCFVGF